MKNSKSFGFAVLSGILCATSFPPFFAWALFFCFVPLWIVWWRSPSLKHVFLTGLVCQFFVTLIGFYWVAHTAAVFGHLPIPLSVLVLFGFCFIANLHIPLSGVIVKALHKRWPFNPLKFFILVALFHGFFEWIIPAIFPWNLGHSLLFSHFQTSQLAEFVGFNGLSIFVLVMNALFAYAYTLYPKKGWSKPLTIFVGVLIFTEVAGFITAARLPAPDKSVKVLLAQTNINNLEEYYRKFGSRYVDVVTDKLLEQAARLLKTEPKPDILVWPENAFPDVLDPFFMGRANQQKLFQLLKENKIGILTGGFSQDFANTRSTKEYSAIFAYDQNAELKGLYRKHILLAFGEYIPGSQYLPFLKTLVPEIGDIGRGPGPQVLNLNGIAYSPVICYEAIHSDFVTASSNLGSHILFNTTIDSWYGRFSEQWQHLILSVARSIELRKPLVRITNTGYSTVSDVKGQMIVLSPLFEEWGKTVDVPYYSTPPRTLYSRIYLALPWCLLLLVTALILGHIRGHANKRT